MPISGLLVDIIYIGTDNEGTRGSNRYKNNHMVLMWFGSFQGTPKGALS